MHKYRAFTKQHQRNFQLATQRLSGGLLCCADPADSRPLAKRALDGQDPVRQLKDDGVGQQGPGGLTVAARSLPQLPLERVDKQQLAAEDVPEQLRHRGRFFILLYSLLLHFLDLFLSSETGADVCRRRLVIVFFCRTRPFLPLAGGS